MNELNELGSYACRILGVILDLFPNPPPLSTSQVLLGQPPKYLPTRSSLPGLLSWFSSLITWMSENSSLSKSPLPAPTPHSSWDDLSKPTLVMAALPAYGPSEVSQGCPCSLLPASCGAVCDLLQPSFVSHPSSSLLCRSSHPDSFPGPQWHQLCCHAAQLCGLSLLLPGSPACYLRTRQHTCASAVGCGTTPSGRLS